MFSLKADLCFVTLSMDYMKMTGTFRQEHQPPSGSMLPENMPGFCAPRVRSRLPYEPSPVCTLALPAVQDLAVTPILASMYIENSGGHHYCLQTVPVLTDCLQDEEWGRMAHTPFHQHHITVMATDLISYSFAVYGFNNGHFLQLNHCAPFDIALSADERPSGRALFKQFTRCPSLSNSADKPLKGIHTEQTFIGPFSRPLSVLFAANKASKYFGSLFTPLVIWHSPTAFAVQYHALAGWFQQPQSTSQT